MLLQRARNLMQNCHVRCIPALMNAAWIPHNAHNATRCFEATSSMDGWYSNNNSSCSSRSYSSRNASSSNSSGSSNNSNNSKDRESSIRYSSSHSSDTIYAVSSGVGVRVVRSGIAVIRISGSKAAACVERLTTVPHTAAIAIAPSGNFDVGCSISNGGSICNSNNNSNNSNNRNDIMIRNARKALYRRLYCPKSKEMLDKAIVVCFPGPNSFTGEDVVELHVHGSLAVVQGVYNALEFLGQEDGSAGEIRPAESGEFTKRAFENNKMDLTEIEGLADLLSAETSDQRKQALRQMSGDMKRIYEGWRHELIKCLAHMEAIIDFGDDAREGDINFEAINPLIPIVENLLAAIRSTLKDNKVGEIIRDGVNIVIVGPPNAGKSSLLNLLSRRPAAIVSPVPGTTRDIVEVRMDIAGVPVILRDTAGIRNVGVHDGDKLTSTHQPIDLIEREGIKRSINALNSAHICVFVCDSSDQVSTNYMETLSSDFITNPMSKLRESVSDGDSGSVSSNSNDNSSEAKVVVGDEEEASSEHEQRFVFVRNKVDLLQPTNVDESKASQAEFLKGLKLKDDYAATFDVSCAKNIGISEFEDGIAKMVRKLLENSSNVDLRRGGDDRGSNIIITRARHRIHLTQCVGHLESFLHNRLVMDVAAEDLRLAMQELGRITGRVDVEELLDVIFRDFCIGK